MTFPSVTSLNGPWRLLPVDTFRQGFYPLDDAAWLTQELPAHWQQHPLLAHYAGRVVYRREFAYEQPDDISARYWLRLNGVFYWSRPFFNGVDLGRNEGYCFAHEHEVTPWVAAENTLVIEVECPNESQAEAKRLITGIFSHWDAVDPLTNPGGIWLPVEVIASGPVRIKDVLLQTHAAGDAAAELRFRATLDSAGAADVTLRWTLTPHNFSGAVQTIEQPRALAAGEQEIAGMFTLRDPHLWWTYDRGHPALYQVRLEVLRDGVVSDSHAFRFGVRTFELREWVPHLNGVRLFARGNNYPPTDIRIATTTRERCDADIALAQACHMNMLRVCSHIGHPALLDAADEAGMLIWQDFPLQWLYRREVLPEAERQLDRAMRALYNHPSLAIWCMHNEPIHVTDPRSDTALDRARSYASVFGWSWNREVLDTHLQRVAQRLDPTRPIVRSSGEFGLPLVRSGTDSHFYYGWYPIYGPLHAWEEFIRAFPGSIRFVTEFGAQSFPNVESCVRFMPEALADIDWEELAQHYAFQPEIMARWIDWRAAGSLAELVELTQEYQSRVNRYYIDRLRYHKYRPTGGALAFVLHDAAPAISWSVVDYWRAPKGSYAALRRAFSPQYLFSLIEDANARVGVPLRIPIYVVNDAPREVFADIEARLVGPGGNELAMIAREFTLPADCMAIEIEQLRLTPTVAGEYQLTLVLQSAAGAELVHTYCIAVT